MRRNLVCLVAVAVLALLVTSCDDAMSPRPWSGFAGKELHVRWCCTLSSPPDPGLAIYQDGTAHAFVIGSGSPPDTLRHVSRVLDGRERATITRLIRPFPTFKSYYPGGCWPDAGGATFTLVCDGVGQSVFICAGSEGVPVELYELGAELNRIRGTLLGERD
jgi:hypothetical protein